MHVLEILPPRPHSSTAIPVCEDGLTVLLKVEGTVSTTAAVHL